MTHRMNTARTPHRSRTIVALLLVSSAMLSSLAGCASSAGTDGVFVEIDSNGGIDGVWILDGDTARFASATCDSLEADLDEAELGALSADGTQIRSSGVYDDTYQLVWFKDHAWYPDGSGFAWDDRGEFVRDDSDAGKAAVEQWQSDCGEDWPV